MSERTPINVRCSECQHQFVLGYLPVELSEMGALQQRCVCPMCYAKKEFYLVLEASDE